MSTWRTIVVTPPSPLFDDCKGLAKSYDKLKSLLSALNELRGRYDDSVSDYLGTDDDSGAEPLTAQMLQGERTNVLRRELKVLKCLAGYQSAFNKVATDMVAVCGPAALAKQAAIEERLHMEWQLDQLPAASQGPIRTGARSLAQSHPDVVALRAKSRFTTRLNVAATEEAIAECETEICKSKEALLQPA